MSGVFKYPGVRKSHQSLNEVYFRTSVIKDWKHLLSNDEMKMIVIQSFSYAMIQLNIDFPSAKCYETGEDEFKMLTYYTDKL